MKKIWLRRIGGSWFQPEGVKDVVLDFVFLRVVYATNAVRGVDGILIIDTVPWREGTPVLVCLAAVTIASYEMAAGEVFAVYDVGRAIRPEEIGFQLAGILIANNLQLEEKSLQTTT